MPQLSQFTSTSEQSVDHSLHQIVATSSCVEVATGTRNQAHIFPVGSQLVESPAGEFKILELLQHIRLVSVSFSLQSLRSRWQMLFYPAPSPDLDWAYR